jgi:carbon monoxide dehydrogenase subunit G
MATIHREIRVAAPAAAVWDAVRDVGAPHLRLTPGVLTDARMDGGDARVVTFANGLVARELIVTVDDERRRVAYASVGGRARHHNASMQVFDDDGGARLVWITDVLPDELAGPIAALVEAGAAAIRRTLEDAANSGAQARSAR